MNKYARLKKDMFFSGQKIGDRTAIPGGTIVIYYRHGDLSATQAYHSLTYNKLNALVFPYDVSECLEFLDE